MMFFRKIKRDIKGIAVVNGNNVEKIKELNSRIDKIEKAKKQDNCSHSLKGIIFSPQGGIHDVVTKKCTACGKVLKTYSYVFNIPYTKDVEADKHKHYKALAKLYAPKK